VKAQRTIALACGALFATGACIAGVTRPSKVLGFLDVGGAWDLSLVVVFATALAVHALAWRIVARVRAPRFGSRFPDPPTGAIDRRLVVGAALFGVGWGLSGYCPGPALVALASGARDTLVFVAAMAFGVLAASALPRDHAS
jgi:uncharacterized membrane protein YedE/YeeE